MQFELEERERIAREEMDRKLAEAVAKGTHTLSDSDSDSTIDPDSPSRQDSIDSDVDSDITVDESQEAEITPAKNTPEKSKPSMQKKNTESIEELFGSDSDGDKCK